MPVTARMSEAAVAVESVDRVTAGTLAVARSVTSVTRWVTSPVTARRTWTGATVAMVSKENLFTTAYIQILYRISFHYLLFSSSVMAAPRARMLGKSV